MQRDDQQGLNRHSKSAFGRLNDQQQLRRSDIEDFLNALHAEQETKRSARQAWDGVSDDTFETVARLKQSPADAITEQRRRLQAVNNQSAASRARGELADGIEATSPREYAEQLDRLRAEMSAPAKLIGAGVGLAGGLAAPLLVPAAPVLSAAVINAAGGALPNWLMNTPEGVGQDAVAGGAMGLAASRIHPLAAIPAALASYAATNTPDAEAKMLRLFSGLSTPNKLNRAFHASTDPVYASKRAMQMSKPDDPMFVHTPKVDDSKLVQFGKTYDTRRAPEAFTNFPRSESISGEGMYEALRPYADEHADSIVRGMGYVGFERPNTGSFGNGRWFRMSDPDGVEQSFAGGGSVGGGLNLLKKALTGQLGLDAGTSHVIKNKGGNWLTGSVEDALKGLRSTHRGGEDPQNLIRQLRERIAENPTMGGDTRRVFDNSISALSRPAHLNNWIDKQLTRYVKNEMATPEDPIRALAERGVLHFDPNDVARARRTVHQSGEVPRVMGESPLARAWEQTSDNFIAPETAGRFKITRGQDGTTTLSRNPWLEKLPNDAIVHDVYESSRPSQLGFSHLTDELANALNPESGLPRHLLLDPNSLPRVSVPQAVERVAQINAWRATQKAEADALLANNAATRIHKEYAENNPMGLRWVELRAPDGDAWEAANSHLSPADFDKQVAQFRKDRAAQLQDALKYEGDTMGHCVGGYCDDVLSGRTQIYSLRDAKGQPHVTVETRPGSYGGYSSVEAFRDALIAKGKDAPQENLDELVRTGAFDPSIVQIKGKGNAKPNDEYLPFVQDFVKSGKWSDVGDLQNTGLSIHAPTGRYITDDEAWGISKRHFRPGGMSNRPDDLENPFQYYNRVSRYDQDMLSDVDKAFIEDWKAGNFAHGGTINTNNLTVGRLRDIIASLNQEQTDA